MKIHHINLMDFQRAGLNGCIWTDKEADLIADLAFTLVHDVEVTAGSEVAYDLVDQAIYDTCKTLDCLQPDGLSFTIEYMPEP